MTTVDAKCCGCGIKYPTGRFWLTVVEWGMPETLGEAISKFYNYAKWDAMSKIWWNPAQGFASHNLKVLAIFARYLAGVVLLYLVLNSTLSPIYLILVIFVYTFWAYKKAGFWGIIIQYVSDFAVMAGFLAGYFRR